MLLEKAIQWLSSPLRKRPERRQRSPIDHATRDLLQSLIDSASVQGIAGMELTEGTDLRIRRLPANSAQTSKKSKRIVGARPICKSDKNLIDNLYQ